LVDHLLLPEPQRLEERRQRGGGGNTPPRNPHQHGTRLRNEFDAVPAVLPRRVVEGVDPRRVFKFAASARIDDDQWRRRGLQVLGDTEDWTYFVVPHSEDVTALRTEINDYAAAPDAMDASAPLQSFFGALEGIAPYGPDDRRGHRLPPDLGSLDYPITVDVLLWPSGTDAEATERIRDVRAALDQYGGEQIAADLRPRTTTVRARVRADTLEAVLELVVVENVDPPPLPFLEPSEWLSAQMDDLELQPPLAETIGVLDDGIATAHPLLSDLVVGTITVPASHTWPDIGSHGTMVAGLAAYGDFEEALASGSPLRRPARIFGARILEPIAGDPWGATRFPSDLPTHRVFEDTIRALHRDHGVRIFNISVTDRFAYEGPHVDVWTEVLDGLVRELDIIVVASAGNIPVSMTSGETVDRRHILHDYPAYLSQEGARVSEPAVAANVLTVGSIARSAGAATAGGASYVGMHAIASVDQMSPFSRWGPGAAGGIKPDLVDYGGNYVWNDLSNLEPNNPGVSTVSLHFDGGGRLFGCASGTSFSAPRVAHIAAATRSRYPDASANLARTLIGLAARVPDPISSQLDHESALRAAGYGLPLSRNATDSDLNRVIMTFDGDLDVDSVVIHPVPMPEEFARGSADREISVALAFDPPVRRTRREYLAATMRVDLYRHMQASDIAEIHQRQNTDARVPMVTDRRRVTSRLRPTQDQVLSSTLQVRRWAAPHANSLSVDDGDTYFLVVTHASAAWAANLKEPYESQRYALAVELVDRERVDIDLYNLVQARVRTPARVRLRA
jgi:Subtilase family